MTNRLEISPTSVIAAACQPAACRQAEVLAGYTLLERLGAGGYGEVWSATGPGGLRKAVKILHGRYDGPHADAELKALECVRELRHPFLLNIERAEVVDGRLIIVTELADRSLDECFNAARRDGERGIAREALLDYLQDAAEALDFMYERHGMAHLDIKPENLFLQGDHLKVGDLGLVKGDRDEAGLGARGRGASGENECEGKPETRRHQYPLSSGDRAHFAL